MRLRACVGRFLIVVYMDEHVTTDSEPGREIFLHFSSSPTSTRPCAAVVKDEERPLPTRPLQSLRRRP